MFGLSLYTGNLRHIMDFKVATLLKLSSGNKIMENLSGSIEVDWITDECGVDGSVLLMKTDVGIWVSAHVIVTMRTECGSCLEEYKDSVNLQIEEEYFPTINLITGEKNRFERVDENNFYIREDNILDLSDAIGQYISLQSPLNFKCMENCRGLCTECGINLNHVDCGCRNKKKDTKLMTLLENFTVRD